MERIEVVGRFGERVNLLWGDGRILIDTPAALTALNQSSVTSVSVAKGSWILGPMVVAVSGVVAAVGAVVAYRVAKWMSVRRKMLGSFVAGVVAFGVCLRALKRFESAIEIVAGNQHWNFKLNEESRQRALDLIIKSQFH